MQPVKRQAGELLRHWREHRRLSQLELSIRAEISTRHLSFLENGRSTPSRDMVLHLADELEIPLRDRNRLLLAAGFAPVYGESSLDAPEMAAVRAAVRRILTGHEPYPAAVVDRQWNLVDGNSSMSVFVDDLPARLLAPPANVLRISLHPQGMAPHIVNLGEWRAHLLGRLRREIDATADAGLTELYRELVEYPCEDQRPHADGDVVVPLRLRHGDEELAFISTVATFGTPADITVAELSIEAFFPADERTADVLRRRSEEARG